MPNKDKKYLFEHYISLDRWASFYHQINSVLRLSPQSMLEVGKGGGILEQYIKHNTEIDYKSLDVERELQPDLVGSVTGIPAEDNSFDLVAAFEVLEHLPFNDFERALLELKRVVKRYVVISLPDSRPHIRFSFKIPLLPRIQKAIKIPFPRQHLKDGEHYWEVGKLGYSDRHIKSIMKKYFELIREFIPFENQYHHFYILEKHDQ